MVQDAAGLNDTETLTVNIVESAQPPTLIADKKEVEIDEIKVNEAKNRFYFSKHRVNRYFTT